MWRFSIARAWIFWCCVGRCNFFKVRCGGFRPSFICLLILTNYIPLECRGIKGKDGLGRSVSYMVEELFHQLRALGRAPASFSYHNYSRPWREILLSYEMFTEYFSIRASIYFSLSTSLSITQVYYLPHSRTLSPCYHILFYSEKRCATHVNSKLKSRQALAPSTII